VRACPGPLALRGALPACLRLCRDGLPHDPPWRLCASCVGRLSGVGFSRLHRLRGKQAPSSFPGLGGLPSSHTRRGRRPRVLLIDVAISRSPGPGLNRAGARDRRSERTGLLFSLCARGAPRLLPCPRPRPHLLLGCVVWVRKEERPGACGVRPDLVLPPSASRRGRARGPWTQRTPSRWPVGRVLAGGPLSRGRGGRPPRRHAASPSPGSRRRVLLGPLVVLLERSRSPVRCLRPSGGVVPFPQQASPARLAAAVEWSEWSCECLAEVPVNEWGVEAVREARPARAPPRPHTVGVCGGKGVLCGPGIGCLVGPARVPRGGRLRRAPSPSGLVRWRDAWACDCCGGPSQGRGGAVAVLARLPSHWLLLLALWRALFDELPLCASSGTREQGGKRASLRPTGTSSWPPAVSDRSCRRPVLLFLFSFFPTILFFFVFTPTADPPASTSPHSTPS